MIVDFYTAGSGLRLAHVSLATLSLALFLLRGYLTLRDPAPPLPRWLRIAPHVVDTAFLGTGIALAVRLEQYPFVNGWLTAKVFGLIAYIVLGSLALKHGRTRAQRLAAFVAALAVFGYIVGVARMRSPSSWCLLLGSG